MVQSLNTKVDLTIDATSFLGINEYGKIMIGDKAFEFYNDRDQRKFIQIPWEDVDYVIASVMFKGTLFGRKKMAPILFLRKSPRKFCGRFASMLIRIIWFILLAFSMC